MATLALGAGAAPRPRLSLPAFLLIAQTLIWIPPVAIVFAVPALPLTPDRGWPPAALAPVRGAWIAHQSLMLLAGLCGCAGVILAARALLDTPARRLAWTALLGAGTGVAFALVWGALHFSLLAFSAPTLGDLHAYWIAWPIIVELHGAFLTAILALGLALRRLGLARRTGLAVAS